MPAEMHPTLNTHAITALMPTTSRRLPPPHNAAGVYVGCMYSEYTQLQYNLGYKISPGLVTGNGISYLVGRVSYTFGLQGGEAGKH